MSEEYYNYLQKNTLTAEGDSIVLHVERMPFSLIYFILLFVYPIIIAHILAAIFLGVIMILEKSVMMFFIGLLFLFGGGVLFVGVKFLTKLLFGVKRTLNMKNGFFNAKCLCFFHRKNIKIQDSYYIKVTPSRVSSYYYGATLYIVDENAKKYFLTNILRFESIITVRLKVKEFIEELNALSVNVNFTPLYVKKEWEQWDLKVPKSGGKVVDRLERGIVPPGSDPM